MRNYLRPEQAKKLTKQHKRASQWRWANSSLTICLLLAASVVVMSKVVFAAHSPKQACVPSSNHMAVLSDDPSPDLSDGNFNHGPLKPGSLGGWQNGNFYFKVFNFYSANDDVTADSGDSCSVAFHVRTGTPEFIWRNPVDNQRAVDVRLGVPNMGSANNNGLWAAAQNLGNTVSVTRPPQYSNNFRSFAAYADDGAMATIGNSARTGPSFRTLWCQNFNPGAVNAGGQGLLPGDGSLGCPSLGTASAPLESRDITSYPPATSGTGFMFTADNCHFAIPPVSDKDGDGSWVDRPPLGPCGSQAGQTTQNMWYWNSMQAFPPSSNVTAVTQGVVFPKNRLTLKDYIGCNGGGLCNGRNDPIDPFDLRQYSRNHLINNPTHANCSQMQLMGPLDACATSAQTVMTFAYPVPTRLHITKTPSGCQVPENVIMSTSNCPSASLNGSYLISIRQSTVAGFEIPLLRSAQIKDIIPSRVSYAGPGSGCNVTTPSGVSGPNLTWDLGPAMLAQLQAGGTVTICYNIRTGTLPVGVTQLAFTNQASVAGVIESSGIPAVPDTAFATNHIVDSKYPYLTTTGGDVHSGGTVCTGASPFRAGSIQGQGQIAGNYSRGEYIVSAGGLVTGNINNFLGANGVLNSSGSYSVCRPDLGGSVATTYTSPGLTKIRFNPSGTWFLDAGAAPPCGNPTPLQCLLQANYGSGGALIEAIGANVTVPGALIQSRVTLYTQHSVILAGNITYSGSTVLTAKSVSSFGVISDANIGIEHGVTNISGFLYSKNRISTCTSSGIAYDSSSHPTRGVDVLKTACALPLTLKGLMSAWQFNFNRVPPTTATIPVATETLNYTGLFLLAPPPVFDLTNPETPGTSTIKVLPPQY